MIEAILNNYWFSLVCGGGLLVAVVSAWWSVYVGPHEYPNTLREMEDMDTYNERDHLSSQYIPSWSDDY